MFAPTVDMKTVRAEKKFDPNGPGIPGNLFGLPYSSADAELIVVPIPWEVTVSYHTGTAGGPQAVLDASSQVDVFVSDIPDAWRLPMAMAPITKNLNNESERLRKLAAQHIASVETNGLVDAADPILAKINEGCESLNIYVASVTRRYLKEGRLVGLLGGDHSTPLGFLRALSEYYHQFGILQIDAHADLRKAYEGFTYSHASIMFNALKLPAVHKLVQVGIRDFCEAEHALVRRSKGRVVMYEDSALKAEMYRGKTWDAWCDTIINELPDNVYISFDIDGLDPKLCPGTGTPVAGGLEFSEAAYLLRKVVESGKKIIGFDLCEVASRETDWDANVGARMLFKLCQAMALSQGKLAAKN